MKFSSIVIGNCANSTFTVEDSMEKVHEMTAYGVNLRTVHNGEYSVRHKISEVKQIKQRIRREK